MKAHLIVLFLCFFVVSCDNMQKPVMDIISDTVAPTEEPFGDVPRITVSDAIEQDKITGPWLWMIVPTEPGKGGPESINIDSLAVASNGVVTEIDVATKGVAAGDMIGDLTWTLGKISGRSRQGHVDNINEIINIIGLARGNLDHYSSYALINIVSDMDRSNLTMRVGSDDSIKIWINGYVVHNNPTIRGTDDFQDEFKIDLEMGDNLLLVKVSEQAGGWGMFIGIEAPSVIPATTVADMPIVPDDPSVYSQYDVNQDGNVDNTDLTLVSTAIGQKQPANPRLDVDGNGIVDGADIILVSDNFGESATDTPQDMGIVEADSEETFTTEYFLPTTPGPDWELGVYRMRVWAESTHSGNEHSIISFSWAPSREFDDHGLVRIIIKPRIWSITLDNEDVIEWDSELTAKGIVPEYDEISLEITRYIGETTDQVGRKTYTIWEYEGRAIANLSRPEIIFEDINP
jgi:hypothetical protein